MTLPKLLTVKELGAQLGLQAWRVYELCARGEGPPHLRIGKTLRFSEPAVAAWIAEKSKQ